MALKHFLSYIHAQRLAVLLCEIPLCEEIHASDCKVSIHTCMMICTRCYFEICFFFFGIAHTRRFLQEHDAVLLLYTLQHLTCPLR